MPYDDYSDIDSLGDFGPPETGVAQMPAPEVRDFNPRQDIDPLTSKYFQDLDNIRGMSDQDRLKFQTEYLSGVDAIKEQRSKVEQDRRRSMMDELNIQRAQGVLGEARRRQIAAVNATESRNSLSAQVRDIMMSGATPDEKREAVNAIELESMDFIASDPTSSRLLNVARSQLPLPEPETSVYSPKEIGQLIADGIPIEVAASGNPFLIGMAQNELKLRQAQETQDSRSIAGAKKAWASQVIQLAREPFNFMDQTERDLLGVGMDSEGNFVGDPNQYLKGDDHVRAKGLARLFLKSKAEFDEFNALRDDEKLPLIRKMQIEALAMAVQKLSEDPEDTLVEKQFGG